MIHRWGFVFLKNLLLSCHCAGRIAAIPGDCKSPAFGHRWFESTPAHNDFLNFLDNSSPKSLLNVNQEVIGASTGEFGAFFDGVFIQIVFTYDGYGRIERGVRNFAY